MHDNLAKLFPADAKKKNSIYSSTNYETEEEIIEEILKIVSNYNKNNAQELKNNIYILPIDLLFSQKEALYSTHLSEYIKKNPKVELAIDWITLYRISLQLQILFGTSILAPDNKLYELEAEHNKMKYTKIIFYIIDEKLYEIFTKDLKLDDFVRNIIEKYENSKQFDGFTKIFEDIIDFVKFVCKETITKNTFVSMLNGPGINKLMQISTKSRNLKVDSITNNATITDGNMTAIIQNFNELSGLIKVSTKKLLDICTIKLTSQNDYKNDKNLNTTIIVSLEEYMKICGVPFTKSSKDKMRIKIKEDLEFIYNLSLEWSEKFGKQIRNFEKMRICDKVGIKNSNIIFNFTKELAVYLVNSYITQYPIILLQIDERNPSVYNMGRKLLLHHSMDSNQSRGIANIISVESLLKNCSDIPTYEEVMAKDRAVERKVIKPFEKALDALQDKNIIEWHYCNSKHVPLTNKQLNDFDYDTFIKSYIHFKVSNAPDPIPRLEAKKEIRKKQTKKL